MDQHATPEIVTSKPNHRGWKFSLLVVFPTRPNLSCHVVHGTTRKSRDGLCTSRLSPSLSSRFLQKTARNRAHKDVTVPNVNALRGAHLSVLLQGWEPQVSSLWRMNCTQDYYSRAWIVPRIRSPTSS